MLLRIPIAGANAGRVDLVIGESGADENPEERLSAIFDSTQVATVQRGWVIAPMHLSHRAAFRNAPMNGRVVSQFEISLSSRSARRMTGRM
jgi:hypothetical protein